MLKNYKDELINKLRRYKKDDIEFTEHAKIQASIRGIDLQEVKNNILNPSRLVFVDRQEAKVKKEEKYDCYFIYSKTQAHRYVIVLNRNVIIVTVIKINRRWQRRVEKHGKI